MSRAECSDDELALRDLLMLQLLQHTLHNCCYLLHCCYLLLMFKKFIIVHPLVQWCPELSLRLTCALRPGRTVSVEKLPSSLGQFWSSPTRPTSSEESSLIKINHQHSKSCAIPIHVPQLIFRSNCNSDIAWSSVNLLLVFKMFVFTIGHGLFLKHLRMGGRSVLCSRLLSTVKETVEMRTRTRFFAAMCKQFWSRPRRWDASDMCSRTNVCSCTSCLLVLYAQHYATWWELAGCSMRWSLFYRYTSETKVVIMDEVPRSWYRHLGIVLKYINWSKSKLTNCWVARCDSWYQWPFQDPKLEVPTIYKAYIRPM
jgi:hypothetical protein